MWALYWRQTVIELRIRLVASGKLDDRSIDTFLTQRADPVWWTQTIAFTTVTGARPRLSDDDSSIGSLPRRDHPAGLPPGSEAGLITGEQQIRATGIA